MLCELTFIYVTSVKVRYFALSMKHALFELAIVLSLGDWKVILGIRIVEITIKAEITLIVAIILIKLNSCVGALGYIILKWALVDHLRRNCL